ncbi:MAG: aspartyl/asparaginyl beta-hydroxylase domain-containing protein [Verrucomicrobiota bacterium]
MEPKKAPLKQNRNTFDKVFDALIDWVEARNVQFSEVGNPPIYESSVFPWAKEIEKDWENIREELEDVLKDREQLPSFHEITKEVETITTDNNWKTFFLAGYGIECEENRRRCPNTVMALEKIPGMKTAMFSILSPGKHIPAHRGPYNGVLRYHLGLVIPEPREQCKIRVHDQYYSWAEGEGVIFDDSFDHEVWNDTDGVRVVLFVDFERPLKNPGKMINSLVINLAKHTPYLKEANDNQKKWEEKFYAEKKKKAAEEKERETVGADK